MRSIVLVILAFAAVIPTAHCQTNAIGVFNVAIDESLPLSEIQDQPIVIRLRQQTKFPPSFHIRIFRETLTRLKSEDLYPNDANGCVKFSSRVLHVSARGSIQFQSLDMNWLKPTETGLETEDYTLVFESGDQPSDSVIRLHRTELSTYFKYAIPMQLHPSTSSIPEAVVKALKITRDQRAQEYASITTSICWASHELPAKDLALRGPREQFLVARLTPVPCTTPSAKVAKTAPANTQTGGPVPSLLPASSSDISLFPRFLSAQLPFVPHVATSEPIERVSR